MLLQGKICRLRAVEPDDARTMYEWENDPDVWRVSGTTAPCSLDALLAFIAEQQRGIYASGGLRLIIVAPQGEAVGAVDLFDFDPVNLRAGVGVLVYGGENRRRGYASDALAVVEEYAREVLHLHQLWCGVGADNEASLALFERAGYEISGRRRDWQRTSDGFVDEVVMQKVF